MSKRKLIIVIPAYEPDFHLPELIDNLNSFFNDFMIVVVNDGSKNHDDIFNECKEKPNVHLISYKENMGKGHALKTAFKYIKDLNIDSIIVTADSDGQHKPEDIKRVYEFYLKHDGNLVLGSRKFENDVPKRSSFGNDVARGLLRLYLNKHLNDTQTGLRAFNSELLDFMLNVKGSRFEYEMNMLSEAVRENITISEIAIETIYINENKASHFRPVRDFSRISACTMKYGIPMFIGLLLDLASYITFVLCFENVSWFNYAYLSIISSFIALFFVTLMNIFGIGYGNRKIFKGTRGLRYLVTCLILLLSNVALFYIFNSFIHNLILIRVITNFMLFILLMLSNYFILRKSKLYEE